MAGESVVGLSLGTDFLKNLEKADKMMDALINKGNQASKSIISAFQQMNSQGVVPFVQGLEKQKQMLDSVYDAITTKTGKARKGYEDMAKSVVDTTNVLTNLISKMKSTSQFNVDSKVMGLSQQIKELQEYQERQRIVREASANAMNQELNSYKQIIERVKELNSIKSQAKDVKSTSTDTALVKDANKALREANAELKILKEQQKKIEQKYAVETALIRKQADTQSFQDKVKIASEAATAVEREVKREKDAYLKSLSDRIKAQQEYQQRLRDLEEARARQQSRNRQASYNLSMVGGNGIASADNAINYANRIYSEKGLKSLNNMNLAIQKMQQAQNRLNLNTEEGRKKYAQLDKEIEKVKRDIDRATNSSENLNKSHTGLLDTTGQLARAMTAVFSVSAIKGYVNKLITIRGEFELQQKALQAIVQNVDEANELWSKTVDLAVRSPFRVKQLVTYTKQLAAYRIETEKLHDTTKMLADVSAGLGVDMNRLILAYGQVKAANYLRGTELRQFSEAGINMLGELAKYFTEIENRAVSVADVFDRVSKRGVSFEDVDVVFQRITNAGGIFYNMQEKQAETLKGQISNLFDSIDLMMNEIGKSNEGVLKGTVSILRSIIDNWETISSIALPIIETLIVRWGVYRTIMKYNALVEAGFFSSMIKNLKASVIYLTQGTKALNSFANANNIAATSVKAGVWGIVIGSAVAAITSLGATIDEHNNALKDITKRYDELIEKIANVSVAFRNAANDNDLKKQKNELQRLVDIANEDYHMKINIDIEGLDKDSFLKKFNELEQQLLETNAFSSSFSKKFQESTEWTATDDIREDFDELKVSYSNLSNEIINKKQLILAALLPVKDTLNETQKAALNELNTAKKSNETQLEYIDRLKNAVITLRKEYDEIRKRKYSSTLTYGNRDATEEYNNFLNYLKTVKLDDNTWKELFSNFDSDIENAKKQFDEFINSIDEDIEGLTKEQAEIKLNAAIDKLSADETWNDFLETTVRRWTEEHYVELGVKLILKEEDGEKTIQAWQDTYNKMFGDNMITEHINESFFGFKAIQNSAMKQSEVIERLQGEYSVLKKTIEAIEKAGGESATQKGGAYEGQDLKVLESNLKDVTAQLDFFGAEYEKVGKKGDDALQRLKKQISLIREAAKAYQDMLKTHDKAYADTKIFDNYRQTFFEAGLGDITKFKFGGLDEELENLNSLKDVAKKVKGAMFELQHAISQVSVNIDDFKQELADKKLLDTIEDMFGKYELSLELEKLNIPSDLAEQLFNVKDIDLSDIRSFVEKELAKVKSAGGRLDLVEDLEKQLEKVRKLEDKHLEENAKKYVKYLVKGQGERVKIKMEELRAIEEIENSRLDDSQKELARQEVRKESRQKLDKLEWEEFKDSGMYVQLFEDLEYASTKALNRMREKLLELKTLLSDLDADDLRNLYNQIEKLDEELAKRNPYKNVVTGVDDYIEALKESKRIEKELETAHQVRKGWVSEYAGLDEQLTQEKNIYEQMSESGNATREDLDLQRMKITSLNAQLALIKSQLAAQGLLTKELEEQLDGHKTTRKMFEGYASEIGQDIVNISNALPTLMGDLEEMGIGFSDSMRDAVESVAEIGAGIGSAIQGFASGDYVQGVLGVTQAISAIFQIGDKKKEREIVKQIEYVERLEKQYEKLKKSIEEAYEAIDVAQGERSARNNIQEQIKARERMIEQEEAKKKTDNKRIQEWYDEIADLREQEKELMQENIGNFGGSFDFRSTTREFVDAWVDAFKETGNGLYGLQENFSDFFSNVIAEQAVMQGASAIMKPLLDSINSALAGDYTITDKEFDAIGKLQEEQLDKLDKFMEDWYSRYGEYLEVGEMSGLQRGIEGVSESTAQIIEALLNSMRFYVADSNTQLKTLVAAQVGASDANTPNPMLAQLQIIAKQTAAIYELFDSVVGTGHPRGRSGIRVFVD